MVCRGIVVCLCRRMRHGLVFPLKKAVETATVEEMVVPIMYFRGTDAFNGTRKLKAHNEAAAFIQEQILA